MKFESKKGSQNLRILFVTPRLPFPPHRGDKLHIYNLFKGLSAVGHQITLISFVASRNEYQYVTDLEKTIGRIRVIYFPPWRSFMNCLMSFFSSVPLQVAFYRSGRMAQAIEEETASHDLVHIHMIRMAQYFLLKNEVPRLLDLTDANSLYIKRFLESTRNLFLKIFLKVELNRIIDYERKILDFDASMVCSRVDKSVLLERVPTANIVVVNNSVEIKKGHDGTKIEFDPMRIVCVGNLAYPPNADSVIYFAEEIFPIVRRLLKGAKAYMVGQNPPRRIRKLVARDFIVTGFVPDIVPEYMKSCVAVAPLRFGAGVAYKIIEPMSLGVPVVASSLSVQGLEAKDRRDLLMANNSEEFAKAIVEIMTNPALRKSLSEHAKRFIRSKYGYEKIANEVEGVYKSILIARPKSGKRWTLTI